MREVFITRPYSASTMQLKVLLLYLSTASAVVLEASDSRSRVIRREQQAEVTMHASGKMHSTASDDPSPSDDSSPSDMATQAAASTTTTTTEKAVDEELQDADIMASPDQTLPCLDTCTKFHMSIPLICGKHDCEGCPSCQALTFVLKKREAVQ